MFHSWQSRNLSDKIAKYASVVFFNVIMWLCHFESLKALSSLQATVVKFAANFLSSGLAGFFLFGEVLSAKALDSDENDEVTPNDVFLHVHTKDHDGVTFIDNRSARFHVRECSKGRVYGLGSLTKRKRRYKDPNAKLVGNAHGLRSKHLSGTTIATTAATTSGASLAGWDGSG
ncbi:hypothetical protein Scep_002041 [Stephania cephalantha]|uniref:Uncharacterized protein n=1 Tax=Stephania cephalantha TaxID=152367 RepID=A0AAP0LA97_9MAGN